jgi:drug/metabolite transporter (DMT)-like permease
MSSSPLVEDSQSSTGAERQEIPISSFTKPIKVPAIDAITQISLGIDSNAEYQRGLIVIGFITLLFASNSPVLHAAFSCSSPPPVLLLNAAISAIALVGLAFCGDTLESNTPLPSSLQPTSERQETLKAGLELGLWKFLGTTANLAGLSLTTADHGAFLIQLTTLIVPVVQGLQGVPIPARIRVAVALALSGVFLFTQDSGGAAAESTALGDALCVVAAGFYATYDLRLFSWGKKVAPRQLITSKIATQALLSVLLLLACGFTETMQYLTSPELRLELFMPAVLWSGIAVNAVAPFLQVGGQQAVGPTRCQTIYASQPLWAGIISFLWLGETVGLEGLAGGLAFMVALFLAATAEAPDPECGQENCEV